MMSFCGQCGFQLATNDARCPRCGTAVEPEGIIVSPPSSESAPDDATIASARYAPAPYNPHDMQSAPSLPGQQKLVLGPGSYPPAVHAANEATSRMQPSAYDPHTSGSSYPGYASQSFSPQTGYPAQYPPTETPRRKSPRAMGLVFIFLGIMLILGALVLFALQHKGIISNILPTQPGVTTGSVVATPPLVAATAVIQHYYDSINRHDYLTAYHLWKNNTEKFVDFRDGYSNTRRTVVTFGAGHMQSTTMAYLPVMITATEFLPATQTTRQSIYKGYYLVQKQADGSWLIFDGNLHVA